jgi:hypothetical protein
MQESVTLNLTASNKENIRLLVEFFLLLQEWDTLQSAAHVAPNSNVCWEITV